MRKIVNLWYSSYRFYNRVHTFIWIQWRRIHQAAAMWYHWRKSMVLQL